MQYAILIYATEGFFERLPEDEQEKALKHHRDLQRVPRGFEADAAAAELLRRKGIVAMTRDRPRADDRLFTPDAVDYLSDILRALSPLNRWINRYVETA